MYRSISISKFIASIMISESESVNEIFKRRYHRSSHMCISGLISKTPIMRDSDHDGRLDSPGLVNSLQRRSATTAGSAGLLARPAGPRPITVVPLKLKLGRAEQHPPVRRPRAVRGGVQERGGHPHAETRPNPDPVRSGPHARTQPPG
jgi:hypothetical protein